MDRRQEGRQDLRDARDSLKDAIVRTQPLQAEFVRADRLQPSTRHTNVDTYERVREQDLKQNAVLRAWFAYNAAMMNERFPR